MKLWRWVKGFALAVLITYSTVLMLLFFLVVLVYAVV